MSSDRLTWHTGGDIGNLCGMDEWGGRLYLTNGLGPINARHWGADILGDS